MKTNVEPDNVPSCFVRNKMKHKHERKKVLEITPQGCGSVFEEWGEVSFDSSLLEKHPKEVALVVFTGGSDVWPDLYGEECLPCTHYNIERDLYESQMFELALANEIPMVGICRGAQFLCVKSGGSLVQDITGHLGDHRIQTSDGRLMDCNSSHHQMQLPDEDAIVLAWSEKLRSRYYLDGDGEDLQLGTEYEVVYYPTTNSLGVQYHPEWLGYTEPCVLFAQEMTEQYLFRKRRKNKRPFLATVN